MSRDVQNEIDQIVKTHPLVLFMKGTPESPVCGFSAQVVQVLNMIGYPIYGVNVLDDPEIREGVKQYADWPTLPQLFVGGEFVGGCDITLDLHRKGELMPLLRHAHQGEDPLNPSPIQELSPPEAAEFLKTHPHAKLLDVRSAQEFEMVHLDAALWVDQDLADKIIDEWPKDTPLLCLCHTGRRSLAAANYFCHHGFTQVYNVCGGMDAWAQQVDPTLKRYS
jgi:monothiol glutaredoxin